MITKIDYLDGFQENKEGELIAFPAINSIKDLIFYLWYYNDERVVLDFSISDKVVKNIREERIETLEFSTCDKTPILLKYDNLTLELELILTVKGYPSVKYELGHGRSLNGTIFNIPIKYSFKRKEFKKKKKGVTVKQHYLPKVYLKRFANNDKLTINLQGTKKEIDINSPLFYQDFLYDYYGNDQYLEKEIFAENYENKYDKLMCDIQSDPRTAIEDNRGLIEDIAIYQYLRHPDLIRQWRTDILFNLRQYLGVEGFPFAKIFEGNLKDRFDKAYHGYKQTLSSKRVQIITPIEGRDFITCDVPLLIQNMPNSNLIKPSDAAGDILFVLSPKIVVNFIDDFEGVDPYWQASNEQMVKVNHNIASKSVDFFLGNKDEIDAIHVQPLTEEEKIKEKFERKFR